MTARRAPSTPDQILDRRRAMLARMTADEAARQKDPARWGEERLAEDDRARLERHGVAVRVNHRGRMVSAHKADIWDRLLSREAIPSTHHAAIRRLEADMAVRAGVGGAAGDLTRVDGGGAGGAQGFTQRQMDAGQRVDDVLHMVGPPACRVLRAVIEPAVLAGGPTDWRAAVLSATGEACPHGQAAHLRFAAMALFECYEMIDKRRQR